MIERRYDIPRVKDTFPMISGIFSHMQYELPMDPSQMDLLFYTDYGLKTICPLVMTFKREDEMLDNQALTLLATMLVNKYRRKWDRDKEVAQLEYDPIHNYLDEYGETGSNTEDETTRENKTETWTETIDTNNRYTRTDNLTQVDSGTFSSSDTGSDAQNRYGLNSSNPVGVTTGSDSVTSSGTNGNTRTNTGTLTNAEVRDEDRGITQTTSGGESKDNDKSYEKEGYHRGNIGNISAQKLLLEEIELWRWNFVEEILHDARDFFTLPLYSHSLTI